MKKFFVLVVAACAMTFVSCGNKNAQQGESAEAQTEIAASEADLENATTELAAQLAAGDVNKFQEAIEAAKTKVAELLQNNPELAKEYLSKVQDFLKENAEKIKSVVGDNAVVSTAVSSLVDTSADDIISSLQGVLGNVEEAANDKVDEAKQAVEDKANELKEAANDKVEEAKQQAADKVNEAAQKANEKVNETADKLLKGTGLK